MTYVPQDSAICKASFFHLRNISRVRKHPSTEIAKRMIHTFITCKPENCNSLLYGIQQYLIQRPQLVQNCTARLIFNKRKFKHVSPLLTDLQRLPIKQCNALHQTTQVIVSTYMAINGSHLATLTTFLTDISLCDRSLRSSNQLLMKVPSTNVVSFGDRACRDSALELCNSVSFIYSPEKNIQLSNMSQKMIVKYQKT